MHELADQSRHRTGAAAVTLLILVTAWARPPVLAQTVTTISDGVFTNADWDLVPGRSVVTAFSSGQQASGGHPDEYQRGSAQGFTDNGSVFLFKTDQVFTPSTDGTIAEIEFEWDFITLEPSPPVSGTGFFVGGALRQGTCVYGVAVASGPGSNTGWRPDRNSGALGLPNIGLRSESSTGPCDLKPDFSATGTAIEFGYEVSFFGTPTVTYGIDDYEVAVTSTEAFLVTEPGQSGSLDHDDVLVGTTSDETLTVRNEGIAGSMLSGNCPGASAPHGRVGGGSFGPLAVDASATCTYRFTPTERGGLGQTLTISSNGGSALINLFGTGVAPIQEVGAAQSSARTRIGTTSQIRVPVTNAGDGNRSGLGAPSNLQGTYPALAGEISGAGGGLSIPDGESVELPYSYTPADHGPDSTSITVSFGNGSADERNQAQNVAVQLDGIGVGPIFGVGVTDGTPLDFGEVDLGLEAPLGLVLANDSTDDDGGSSFLTRLTLRAEITGPDSGSFRLGADPPTLNRGEQTSLQIFALGEAPGPVSALLTIYCDEDAPLGDTDAVCAQYPLEAEILPAIPTLGEVGLGALALALALLGVLFVRRSGPG